MVTMQGKVHLLEHTHCSAQGRGNNACNLLSTKNSVCVERERERERERRREREREGEGKGGREVKREGRERDG
ncbi:hypothetical protein LEMLEM_LOCUS27452 [Lemmus lemmus]